MFLRIVPKIKLKLHQKIAPFLDTWQLSVGRPIWVIGLPIMVVRPAEHEGSACRQSTKISAPLSACRTVRPACRSVTFGLPNCEVRHADRAENTQSRKYNFNAIHQFYFQQFKNIKLETQEIPGGAIIYLQDPTSRSVFSE